MTIETTPAEILEFWFGPEDRPDDVHSHIWWGQVDDLDALDAEVRTRFEEPLARATKGELDDWLEEPASRLAYIILLDQFSRNIYRGTAKAFDADPRARETVLDGIDREHDRALPPLRRLFFYMPLMHDETLEVQNLAVHKFRELAEETSDEATRDVVEGTVEHAVEHRDIIERFGRFPHRNHLLGRTTTEEERTYLKEEGKWYGQQPDPDDV